MKDRIILHVLSFLWACSVAFMFGGFYVNDVILLQVIVRRCEDVFTADVVEQDSSLVPIFADDGDTVQTGSGGSGLRPWQEPPEE